MTTSPSDYFGSNHQQLDYDIILAVGIYDIVGQTVSLPAGRSWKDYEFVDFVTGRFDGDTELINSGSTRLDKELIDERPTNWHIDSDWSAYRFSIKAINNHQCVLANITGNPSIRMIKGYRRRYATQNVSAIVNVNGGANIGANQRYEIDIATDLGADYVGKDLIVRAEISDNTTGEFAATGRYTDNPAGTPQAWFTEAEVSTNGKIYVATGKNGVIYADANLSGHGFSNPNSVAGPHKCRVIVWKVDKFIPAASVPAGAGSRTTLYEGSVIGGGSNVPLNDSMSNYDAIRVYQTYTVGGDTFTSVTEVEPADLLTPFGRYVKVGHWVATGSSGNEAFCGIDTNTTTASSLAANTYTVGASANGIYKVVGIKY